MSWHEERIECPDGRVLEVATIGNPEGPTVFFHHGTPGSSRSIGCFAPYLRTDRFLFVTTSRAGYGPSTRLEGRDIASVVDDVRVALDGVERREYVALGWSGGGPHALACGALDAPRCQKVVTVASVVPIDADIDWTAGMGPENLEEFALAQAGGPAYEAYMEAAGAFMAVMDVDNAIEMFGGLLSAPDREFLKDSQNLDRFVESTRYAFEVGWRGFYDDDVAFYQHWGFDPTAIEVPVAVYYGDHDLMVPPTHGAWLSSHLATATAHHSPASGHLSIFEHRRDDLVADLSNVTA